MKVIKPPASKSQISTHPSLRSVPPETKGCGGNPLRFAWRRIHHSDDMRPAVTLLTPIIESSVSADKTTDQCFRITVGTGRFHLKRRGVGVRKRLSSCTFLPPTSVVTAHTNEEGVCARNGLDSKRCPTSRRNTERGYESDEFDPKRTGPNRKLEQRLSGGIRRHRRLQDSIGGFR